MTEKTVSTTKVEVAETKVEAPVKKPAAKKAAPKKAPARKAVAKKAPAKKAVAKKVPAKTVFERIEESPIAVPFKAANKTFMASIGLLSFVQKELDKQYREFDKKFSAYAKDGEKVFDLWEDKVEDFRKDVEKKVDEARGRVKDTFKKAA